eukprot:7528279-Pyramimonas_sp.AAC.1
MASPSTALREHQPQALQGRTRHLTKSTPRRRKSAAKAMSNVVPLDNAEEARGGSPIRDRVAAQLEVRPPNERAAHDRQEV